MERKNGEIRKGPWKAEEDEVLVNHVKKYGPRDWSSIRTKGLLHRTGKSCRLRWVNKLRPNLKNGCKFTAEEERVVIELQAQFGNKWARIATYLPGRTDNDVKNFWSSRQKRLARILQNSATTSPSSSNSKPLKSTKKEVPIFHHVPTLEAPMLSSSMEEVSSSKAQSCSSSTYMEDLRPDGHIKMVPLPDLVVKPEFPICDANYFHHQFDPHHSRIGAFPQLLPQPQPQPQPELHQLAFSSPETQLLHRPEDPFFLNVFGAVDVPELGGGSQVSLSSLPLFDPMASFMPGDRDVKNPAQDTLFDDFPDFEYFDHI